MCAMASQIISLMIVYSTVYSDADQRKHQSSMSLAFVWGIHWWPVNSPHKWSVMRKMSPFDDVIMWVVLARLSTKKDVNTLRPRKNVWQFADNILKCHYLNENAWISIKILLKFVSRVQSTIFQHWLRSWLGVDQATSHNLNQGWLAYCCIHVSFSLNGNYNELTHCITAV